MATKNSKQNRDIKRIKKRNASNIDHRKRSEAREANRRYLNSLGFQNSEWNKLTGSTPDAVIRGNKEAGSSSYSNNKTVLVEDAFTYYNKNKAKKEIHSKVIRGVNHNIAMSSRSANKFNVDSQFVSETLERIENINATKNNPLVGFAVDTEWLGSAPDKITGDVFGIDMSVTEIGFSFMNIHKDERGKLKLNTRKAANDSYGVVNDSIAFALQINKTTEKDIRELIIKIREDNIKLGNDPRSINSHRLTNEQYRTLRDLASYADDNVYLGEGIIDRSRGKSRKINKQNIHHFLEDIEKGLNNLSSNNDKSKALAVDENTFDKMNKAIRTRFNIGIEETELVAMQNKQADLVSIEKTLGGLDENILLNIMDTNIIWDTLEMERAANASQLYENIKEAGKSFDKFLFQGAATLDTLSKTKLGKVLQSWHHAGYDASTTNQVMKSQLSGNKSIIKKLNAVNNTAKDFINGNAKTILTAIGAVKTQYAQDMSFDITKDINGKIEYSAREGVGYATTKFVSYHVEDMFEEVTEDGKKMYGVMLSSLEGGTKNKIVANSIEELQSRIHNNFIATEAGDPDGEKLVREINEYGRKQNASRAYRSMYAAGKTTAFEKNLGALNFIASSEEFDPSSDLYKEISNGEYTDKTKQRIKELLEEYNNNPRNQRLTNVQKNNFVEMFPRLLSEREEMNRFKIGYLDVTENGVIKEPIKTRRALYEFQKELNRNYKEHVTKVSQPKGIASARMINPLNNLGKSEVWANVADKEGLAWNIQSILKTGLTDDMSLADAQTNAIEFINYLRSEQSVKDLFTDTDGVLNNKAYDNATRRLGAGKKKEAGLISKSAQDRIMKIITQTKSGSDMRGIRDLAALISDELHSNLVEYNKYSNMFGVDLLSESMEYRKNIANTPNSKVDIPTISNNVRTYASSSEYKEPKFIKHLKDIDDYIENNVYRNIEKASRDAHKKISTKSDIKASNKGLSVLESFEKMTESFMINNISAEFRLSEDGRNIITTMASASNTAQDLLDAKNTATFNIPLLDMQNGLLDISGTKKVNTLNPVLGKNGKLVYGTYQNKIFKTLGYKNTLVKVSEALKKGDTDAAKSIMEKQIRITTSGVASGSSHGFEKVQEKITSSSLALNRSRGYHVDLNDLMYELTKNPEGARARIDGEYVKMKASAVDKIKNMNISSSGISLSNISSYDRKYRTSADFLRAVFEDPMKGEEIKEDGLVTMFRNLLIELNGGEMPSLTALKSEKSGEGYVVLNPGDSRRYGIGGHTASMESENSRSVLNHKTLNIDDYIFHRDIQLTREEYLQNEEFTERQVDKLFNRYVQTEQMTAASVNDNISINLKTAFMSSEQLEELFEGRNIYDIDNSNPEMRGLVHAFGKPHLHDDTMYISSKVAPLFGTYQEHIIEFDDGVKINDNLLEQWRKLESGEISEHIIEPGDKLGMEIGSFGSERKSGEITYDRTTQAVLQEITSTEKGTTLIKVNQFIPGEIEGSKLQGAHGGSKITTRIMPDETMKAVLGNDIYAAMNISERKLASLPGDFISSQMNLVLEAANIVLDEADDIDTVGKAVTREVNDYLFNVVYSSNKDKMTESEARKIVNEHFKIEEIKTATGKTGITVTSMNDAKANYDINLDVLRDTTERTLKNNTLSKSGVVNNVNIDGVDTHIGNMQFVRINNYLEHKTSGITGDGAVKLTQRELKYLSSKKSSVGEIDGENAVDIILNHLDKTIRDSAIRDGSIDANKRAYASMATTFFDQNGTGRYFNRMGLGIGKSRVPGEKMLTIGIGDSTGDGSFISIDDISSTGRSVGQRKIHSAIAANTILDPKGIVVGESDDGVIRHKGAFMLELPETFKHGDIEIDKLAIDMGDISGDGVYVMPTQQQKLGAQLVEAVREYDKWSTNPDGASSTDVERATAKFQSAKERLYGSKYNNGLISNYITETTTSLTSSKGELYQATSTKLMNASARLKLQGLNPNLTRDVSMIEELANFGVELEENTIILSRNDFDRMTDGLSKEMKESAFYNATHGGENAFGIRYPSHHESSMQAMKIRVLGENQEEALREMGIQMDGNMYLTVGTQMRLKADYDGDHGSIFMPQYQSVDGKNISVTQSAKVSRAMDLLHQREMEISKYVAVESKKAVEEAWNLGKLNLETKDSINVFEYLTGVSGEDYLLEKGWEIYNESDVDDNLRRTLIEQAENNHSIALKKDDGSFYNVLSGKDLIKPNDDILAMAESRLSKNVGTFSNTHTKIYRKAEVAMDYISSRDSEKAKRMGVVMEALGSNIEQIPISSKNITKMGGNMLDMKDTMDRVQKGLDAIAGNGFKGGTVGQLMKDFESLGWLVPDENNHKKLVFKGLKKEELVASAKSAHGGGILKDNIITGEDIEELLYTIDATGNGESVFYDFGIQKTGSVEKAERVIQGIAEPLDDPDLISTYYEAQSFFKNIGYDDDYLEELHYKTRELIAKRGIESGQKVELAGINKIKEVVSDDVVAHGSVNAIMNAIGESSTPFMKGLGIGAGALFLAGSVIDGPKITSNVQQGVSNQAPATDGAYIEGYDPNIFAGAPIGAEPPQARLIENNKGAYSRINLNISGKGKDLQNQQELAMQVANQVGQQLGVTINVNMNSSDSREHLDQRWIEDQFEQALIKGRI